MKLLTKLLLAAGGILLVFIALYRGYSVVQLRQAAEANDLQRVEDSDDAELTSLKAETARLKVENEAHERDLKSRNGELYGSPTEWDVIRKVNPLDGKARISLMGSHVVVRCTPKFDGYVLPKLTNLGGQLSTDALHSQTVRFRLDDGPLTKQSWAVSDSFDSLFIPTTTLRRVIRAQKLVVEYKPEYVSDEIQTFDLRGLGDAFTKAGCK